jgi:hypothetical protein
VQRGVFYSNFEIRLMAVALKLCLCFLGEMKVLLLILADGKMLINVLAELCVL